MGNWRRYAIYYTATGPLADFGAAWLGWDMVAGTGIAHPVIPGLTAERIGQITATLRRYGFHATLKPPFVLNPSSSETALSGDLTTLARSQAPVIMPGGLQLASLDGFPALVPAAPTPPLADLAARLVADLDHHRAPLTPADRARRNPEALSPVQRSHLDRWGYPWVMDQFRFHMTLGYRMPAAETAGLIAILQPQIGPLLPVPFIIDGITLAGEDTQGRIHQIRRVPLSG